MTPPSLAAITFAGAFALLRGGPATAAVLDSTGKTGWPAAASAPAGPLQDLLTQGYRHLQAGRTTEAERVFRQVVQQDASNVSALTGLAEAALRSGRTSEAETLLKRAVAAAPEDPDVLVAMSRFHASQGRPQQSLALLRQVTERHPDAYPAFRDLGDLLLNAMKQPREAATAYRRAAELQPQAVAPRFGLAMSALALGRKAEALATLQKASAIAPDDPVLPHMAGRIHASEKRFPQAVAAFDRALAARPDFVPALSDRADVQAEARNDRAALADYERLVTLQPANPTLRLKAGLLYHRVERLDDARAAYLEALRLSPALALAYNNLAAISLDRKEAPAQALAWARRAVDLDPKVPHFQGTLGRALLANGERLRAVEALESAARLGPNVPEVQVRLGEAYEAAGRKADALQAYRRALAAKQPFAQAGLARARVAALGS